MLPENILKKIREVEIRAQKLSNSVILGRHQSMFKGNGIDFEDLREYRQGDDVRSISWRQSAKANHLYVKKYAEERDINIILMLDVSASGNFGSHKKFNAEAAAEFAATIAMSAIKSGDRVGLVLFSGDTELFIPPRKGRAHITRIIREILFFKPTASSTNIPKVFKTVQEIIPKGSHVLLLTDIWSELNNKELLVFAKRHDLGVITFYDQSERRFYDVGNMEIYDIETGENIIVNTSSKKIRSSYEKEMNILFQTRKNFLDKNAIRGSFVNNKDSIYLEILKYYSMHKK